MLKIDTHAHYLPRDWPDLAAKYGDNRFPVIHHGSDGGHRIYKDGKFFREIRPKTWDPQERIADYARFGVQVQVISTVPVMFSYWAAPNQALELHQSLNDHMAQTCRDVLTAAGCGPLLQEGGSYDDFASTHVMGTCRMGLTAQDSVTNDLSQVHGWPNLLICDGSTFPSSGGGESPSLTIQALALRAIDRFVRAN